LARCLNSRGPRQPSRDAAREKALKLIAVAPGDKSLNSHDVFDLIDKHHLDQAIIDYLVQCDAIRFEAKAVRFEHEALSDYLRALEIAAQMPAEALTQLHTIRLEADSLFPVLLASVLPSVELRNELWLRVLELDVRTYINMLRYRADLSDDIPIGDADDFAHRYLAELLDGLEAPLIGFFPQIQRVVRRALFDIECNSLAVLGNVRASDVEYALLKREDREPRVVVGNVDQTQQIYFVNLHLSGLLSA
jgi:hypothetical protein